METLAPPQTPNVPDIPGSGPEEHAMAPEVVHPEVPAVAEASVSPEEAQESSRMRRAARKAAKIALGEGVGTAVEAGMMAAGIPLPARELAGTAIDLKTYGPDGVTEQLEVAEKASRRGKLGRAAGLLALNLASGYAMQKGAPVLMDMISDNFSNGAVEGGVQLAGKIGVMSGATSVLGRRFGI